ncbi:rRNA (guanine-N(2)-)-methyltransferase [Pseudothermotoga thermarum DSM 5069]|uniref:rRNA (Guanine-N(2)-)-methyltransferase n=1 Tax=Pseudothermotoga thermarum DSM 5069 TaxID=688269 RepID=F7YYC6_9THEM|nr:rRNA (guanine-N(2)-)-methyltransferase [Pseudothermotoga thermarum DSM 5069]
MLALCSAGLEQAPCLELKRMGYKILKVTAGHVYFDAKLEDIPRLNISLYSVDRLLISVGRFEATTFDQLFDGTYSLPWENFVHKDAELVVEKVKIRSSKLSATGAVASVVKKAIYQKINSSYQAAIKYPLYVYIKNNVVELALDTTGENSLSRRGYRIKTSVAPLRETIAAALLLISGWDMKKLLVDPFCGSGTIPIEAARMALGILNNKREFAFQKWPMFSNFKLDEFERKIVKAKTVSMGFDIDETILKVAKENAARAGVLDFIRFEKKDFFKLDPFDQSVHVVTNPPYGLRIEGIDNKFYRNLARFFVVFPHSTICVITSKENLEKLFGKKPRKKFRFQNSGIWTWCYIF